MEEKKIIYLARIPIKKSLPFKFKFAWVLTITTYVHHPMMITIDFANDKVMDASCNLKTELEDIEVYVKYMRKKLKRSKSQNHKDKISHLAPLKPFSIIKLKSQYSNGVKLNCLSPKSRLQVTICPELPPSAFTMACYESRVVADLGI